MKPTLIQPWPDDLPDACPQCGKAFQYHTNLQYGPGKWARLLRKIAWAMVVPWMVAATVIIVSIRMPNYGMSGGWLLITLMFLPTAIIAASSLLFLDVRSVTCNACHWHGEFPLLKKVKPNE